MPVSIFVTVSDVCSAIGLKGHLSPLGKAWKWITANSYVDECLTISVFVKKYKSTDYGCSAQFHWAIWRIEGDGG